jgi:AraC-like DNA-binding protein
VRSVFSRAPPFSLRHLGEHLTHAALRSQLDFRSAVAKPPALDFFCGCRTERPVLVRSAPRSIADCTAAAEAAGISRRTFQRLLASHGTSYSDLRDEMRFTTATRLLEFTSLAIVDIAFVLGYSDGAHFTRAFRRWCYVPKRRRFGGVTEKDLLAKLKSLTRGRLAKKRT